MQPAAVLASVVTQTATHVYWDSLWSLKNYMGGLWPPKCCLFSNGKKDTIYFNKTDVYRPTSVNSVQYIIRKKLHKKVRYT